MLINICFGFMMFIVSLIEFCNMYKRNNKGYAETGG